MVKDLNPKRLHRSFRYASRGIWHVLRNESNLRIHIGATAVVITSGIVLGITGFEFAIILLAIGLVLTAEVINTVIEDFLDILHPDHHDAVRRIKDALAGAVLLAAFVAIGVGVLIFGPYLLATP
ncbi:MAG: diacylglycerol kinase family protein [bacterium]|nr:diacylglycerol kinase family protein [bacterium]